MKTASAPPPPRRWILGLALAALHACSAPPAPPPANERPRADAGEDQTVALQTLVRVSGANSSDPEGAPLSFNWRAAEENPAPVIFAADQVGFDFTPIAPGTYIFVLEVSDGELTSLPDSVRIRVGAGANSPPIADAGPDLIVEAGASVPLSGLNSRDTDGDSLRFLWRVLSAPAEVELADSTAAQTRFAAAASGEYRFRLEVSDGTSTSADEVVVLVRAAGNVPPVADAGPDQQVAVGALVTLDGTASSDPDGDAAALTYRWRLGRAPGGRVDLSDSTAARPTFIATEPGEYVFGLEVSDGTSTSAQDVVTILVLERAFEERNGMIQIPAGAFVMGTTAGAPDERPPHRVELDAYWIDKFEVTAAQYQACVDSGTCSAAGQSAGCNAARSDRLDHPINCVTWDQASTYCLWAGKRLPTEAEWERAARGDDGRTYPWGEAPPGGERLNYNNNIGATVAVGTYPLGASFYGLHNMAGNVQEWTADYYAADYYANSPSQNPPGPESGTLRVGRGASWKLGVPQEVLTATVRFAFVPATSDNSLGFRCATDAPPP